MLEPFEIDGVLSMMLFDLIKSYKKRDPAARSSLEILFLYPGIKALFLHRIAHALFIYKIPFIPKLISEISRWLTGIEIHPGAVLGRGVVIDHGMGIVIGETARVGNDVLIYHGVTLGGTELIHGKRHPTIEDGVVLGAGCKVLGNIVVGQNSRVGANSVVLTHVGRNLVVVGVPARIIEKEKIREDGWKLDYQI